MFSYINPKKTILMPYQDGFFVKVTRRTIIFDQPTTSNRLYDYETCH
ncbi:MAG: hypothetical protein AB8E82_12865 [Aureispira sp.]